MKLIASTSLLAAIILGGCSLKDPAPSDSARAADSIDAAVGTVDPTITDTNSAAVTGDSAGSTMPPADASGNLTGETKKSGGTMGTVPPPRADRDSAFGPIGTMDSAGNIRPIKK
jgi:PBP1b-binding outer membrane lipoprotein LpoB